MNKYVMIFQAPDIEDQTLMIVKAIDENEAIAKGLDAWGFEPTDPNELDSIDNLYGDDSRYSILISEISDNDYSGDVLIPKAGEEISMEIIKEIIDQINMP